MATEVTKLISVSLGKMHQSRQTKCGLNLRRSLLVASVLHKARDAYVTEIKNRKVDSQRPSETAAPAPEPVRKRRFTAQRSMVDSTSDQNSNNNLDNNVNSNSVDIKSDTDSNESVKRVKRDAVSSTTVSTQKESQSCAVADNVLDMLAFESETESCDSQSNTNIDKENSPPSTGSDDKDISNKQHNNAVASSLSSCGRCSLKRRYSQNDWNNGATTTTSDDYPSLEDSSNQDNNFSKQKRSKADTLSTPSDNNTSLVSAVNSTDTTQINDLVQMLRQSFPEFTPTEEDHHDSSILSSTSSGCDTNNTFSIREAIVLTA